MTPQMSIFLAHVLKDAGFVFLQGLAGIVCGLMFAYAILSQ